MAIATMKTGLVGQIEAIAIDGLDPMHTREALVLKIRQIYQLAVLANAGLDVGDDGNDSR
jgi:hypothetical protein